MKKYIAELFGTFTLSFLVFLSISGKFPIPTPILASLCLTLFVYTIGSISGSHLNPAVTIGLLSIKKIKRSEAVKYIIFQILGAFLAISVLSQLSATIASPVLVGGFREFFAEILGTMVFTFGVASVVYGNAPGVIVGGSLLLGISIAALVGSAGILNPAVALVLHAFYPTYIFGEIIGSLIGFYFYQWLNKPSFLKKKKIA
jgi:glycerol uptake facilitator-like aquaporin